MSSARDRILDVTSALVESRTGAVPTMAEVAQAAGISRQGLYLHFPDRAALLVALVEYVDARRGLADAISAVVAAPDGQAQVRAWVQMPASRNPRIASLARALDQARYDDASAAATWRDRSENRRRGATDIARRLRREGRLHRSWTTAEAATLLWELVSFRVWDDLVDGAGLTPERYVEIVTATALAALAAPVRRARRDAQ